MTHSTTQKAFDSFYQIATHQTKVSTNQKGLRKLFALPAYYWMLIGFFMTTVCHMAYIPLWLSVLSVMTIVCQLPVLRHKIDGKFGLVRTYKAIQLIVFFAGLAGIWLSFGQIFGADVSICFLLLCAICKLWESFNRRDGYIVLNLSLFVLASVFLWEQGLLLTLGAVVALLTILFAFIALSDDGSQGDGRLKTLALIGAPAVPLLIVLFLFFPRIAPLWSVNMAGKQATTGVSDSMSPGDFASLSKSSELAFRVEFGGDIPARHQLYWRGLVFSQFDGITWRPTDANQSFWRASDNAVPAWASALQGANAGSYRVILEPTHQQWLFGLDFSRPQPLRGLALTSEYNLRSYRPIDQQFHYVLDYYPDAKMGLVLSQSERQINLQLPSTGNTQSRQLAQTLRAQSHDNPEVIIQSIHRYVLDNQFTYTLSPPPLGDNRIDEFLFGSKAGFCEHYASSFVFLMRAAGFPARVVVGYQGGEHGRDGNSWEVRQMDAHAWAEVWIENEGWVRVDPTTFVSPDRIEDGMMALTNNLGSQMFGSGITSQMAYQQFRLLSRLRSYSDQMSYYWQKDVVGFDQNAQKNSLLTWFNITNLARQLQVLFGSVVLLVGAFALVYWYKNRKTYHALDLPIVQLSKRFKKNPSLQQQTGETPLAYLARLTEYAKSTHPNQTADIDALFDELYQNYRALRYGKNENAPSARAFARQIAAFKRYL